MKFVLRCQQKQALRIMNSGTTHSLQNSGSNLGSFCVKRNGDGARILQGGCPDVFYRSFVVLKEQMHTIKTLTLVTGRENKATHLSFNKNTGCERPAIAVSVGTHVLRARNVSISSTRHIRRYRDRRETTTLLHKCERTWFLQEHQRTSYFFLWCNLI